MNTILIQNETGQAVLQDWKCVPTHTRPQPPQVPHRGWGLCCSGQYRHSFCKTISRTKECLASLSPPTKRRYPPTPRIWKYSQNAHTHLHVRPLGKLRTPAWRCLHQQCVTLHTCHHVRKYSMNFHKVKHLKKKKKESETFT